MENEWKVSERARARKKLNDGGEWCEECENANQNERATEAGEQAKSVLMKDDEKTRTKFSIAKSSEKK